MEAEYHALMRNQTWTLVPSFSNFRIVDNKWVFKIKRNPDGSIQRHKARFVEKGFQQRPGIDFQETFSPVIKPSTVKVVLSVAVSRHWDVRQIDVNNAFLNGILTEEVFMKQPEGFVDPAQLSAVCKLNRSLYGLRQAPRAWYDRLKSTLCTWGFQNSKMDSSLFTLHTSSGIIWLLVYVDDILITGNNTQLLNKFVLQLNNTFALKDLGSVSYFLGVEAVRTS